MRSALYPRTVTRRCGSCSPQPEWNASLLPSTMRWEMAGFTKPCGSRMKPLPRAHPSFGFTSAPLNAGGTSQRTGAVAGGSLIGQGTAKPRVAAARRHPRKSPASVATSSTGGSLSVASVAASVWLSGVVFPPVCAEEFAPSLSLPEQAARVTARRRTARAGRSSSFLIGRGLYPEIGSKMTPTLAVADGADCFRTTTVQRPARWASRAGSGTWHRDRFPLA